MMRTKDKYEALRDRFQEMVSETRVSTDGWRRATRMVRLIEILHGLGFGPDMDDQYNRICVDYRGHRYMWLVRHDVITVFIDVGTYQNPMCSTVWSALGTVINETLSVEIMVNIFCADGVIKIFSEQYLGKRELDGDVVMYMLNNISDVTCGFRTDVRDKEELKGYVVCR